MPQTIVHKQNEGDLCKPTDLYYEGRRYTFIGNQRRNFADRRVAAAIDSASSNIRSAGPQDGDTAGSGTMRT
jgi:hypothetical protein